MTPSEHTMPTVVVPFIYLFISFSSINSPF